MTAHTAPIRDEVRRISPYNAGLTLDEVRQRFAPARIAKLGSNENPFGPSAAVRDAVSGALAQLQLYPDPQGRKLRAALAAVTDVSPDRIMLGNGSEDLLGVICRAVLRQGDTVVTLYPSFPLHEDYTLLMGAHVSRIAVRPDLTIDQDGLVAATHRTPRMVMFSNPMNPVGAWLDTEGLRRVIDACSPQTLLVIDEAYAEYAEGSDYSSSARILESSGLSWIVLRTFSKAYGLAGLRIGYGIAGDPELCGLLDRVRTPFNTNGPAQSAALAALADQAQLAKVVTLAAAERERLHSALHARGFAAAPSRGNFLFFDCRRDATDVAERLLAQGVIVKPWKQPGFTRYLRVSIGSREDNDHFLEALGALSA